MDNNTIFHQITHGNYKIETMNKETKYRLISWACETGNLEVIKYLVEMGVDFRDYNECKLILFIREFGVKD